MTKRDIGIYDMLLLAAIVAFGWGWAVTQKLHGHIYDYRPVMLLQAYAPPPSGSAGSMVIFLLTTRPAPFILIAEGVFYLCAFVQHYRAAKQNHVDADPYGFAAERVLILDSLG